MKGIARTIFKDNSTKRRKPTKCSPKKQGKRKKNHAVKSAKKVKNTLADYMLKW